MHNPYLQDIGHHWNKVEGSADGVCTRIGWWHLLPWLGNQQFSLEANHTLNVFKKVSCELLIFLAEFFIPNSRCRQSRAGNCRRHFGRALSRLNVGVHPVIHKRHVFFTATQVYTKLLQGQTENNDAHGEFVRFSK
jgi:hypothetical protein